MKSILSFFLLLLGSLTFGQSFNELIPRELFFKEKDKSSVSLSMDGETVYYKKNVEGAENSLFYVNSSTPIVERSKKFDGRITDYIPVYDDGLVAVIAKDTVLALQFTTSRSGKIRTVETIPFQRIRFLHLSERFPNKIAVDIKAKESSQDGIYLVDLLNSSSKRLGKMDDMQQLLFDQNFTKVAALWPNELGGNTIARFHEGEWKTVFEYPFHPEMFIGGLSRIISVSKDGKTIYATDNFNKDKTTFVSIDVQTGEVTELASDPDADMLPYAASINRDGIPTSVVALWGDTRRYFFDETVKQDFEFLEGELQTNLSYAGASADDKTWLIRTMNGGPIVYYLYQRDEQRLTKLFNDYSHFDSYDLPTRKTYTVTTRDSLKLPVHLYVPPGMAKADGSPRVPLPTIIYIHGGPWAGVTHWNSWFHTRNFQLLSNRGYAVIHMEFRGTTGLGKQVCDAGNLQWGEAMHHDIVDVATWAIRSEITNPKRLGMWGWSYGGYATNFALATAPDLFTCGISMYGITDLYAFSQIPFADNDHWHSRVGDPNTEEGASLLKKHSPSTYLNDINSPLLLTTGGLDERVPQSQADNFADALAEAGKEVIYFYYPEEVHDYRKPESWISFWAIAEDFLHQHVGGRKEPRKEDIEKGNFIVVHGADYIEEIK